jgi:hypothetical protein
LASNDCQSFDIAGFVGPDDQTKADAVALFVQENYLDVRQRLNTLPTDDPDRTTDPARATLFWDGRNALCLLAAKTPKLRGSGRRGIRPK